MLRETLAALPIAYEKFAFVDYGSGKGRTLLIASEFPFKFIIGVEFAAELHRICEANRQVKDQRCHDACQYVQAIGARTKFDTQ